MLSKSIGTCILNLAKILIKTINAIVDIILAFPRIARPLSSLEVFTKNIAITAIVIGIQ